MQIIRINTAFREIRKRKYQAIYNYFTTNERALCNDLWKVIQSYGRTTLEIECLFLCSETADYFISA